MGATLLYEYEYVIMIDHDWRREVSTESSRGQNPCEIELALSPSFKYTNSGLTLYLVTSSVQHLSQPQMYVLC